MPKERKRSRKEPEHEDTESEEEEAPKRWARGSWREDLRLYMTQKMAAYLAKNKFTKAKEEILKCVLDGYINKLMNGELEKHTKTSAWKKILEKAKNF